MAWDDPTPADGARLTGPRVTAAVTLSRAALVDVNGQAGVLEPNPRAGFPFRAQADLQMEEGVILLTARAVDGGGNQATLSRSVAVGLTAPTLTFTAPAFDAGGTFRSLQAGLTVTGSVTAPEVVKPLTLTLNGQSVPLDAQGGFTWTFTGLAYGSNPLQAVAANAFGQKTTVDRRVDRGLDPGGEQAPKITVESPLEAFATGAPNLPVVGRVNQPGLTVTVQNRGVPVDPLTLRFSGTADLVVGPNTIEATATDAQGRSDRATLHGTRIAAGQSHFQWDQPRPGVRLASRSVGVAGQADQPGIQSLAINGVPMALSGLGAAGAFQGTINLPKGPQSLLLEAVTVAGEHLSERRDVIIDPPLPRIALSAPDSARPGEEIVLSVQPLPGTHLASVDLSWNGGLLAHLADPFAAQKATVPVAAASGDRILVEAIGHDAEGETVTARTYVVVLAGGSGGGGPRVLSAFDDRSGLPLSGATALLDGVSDPVSLGNEGRATLPALLPDAWVKVAKAGHAPVWRRGGQLGSKPLALFDARPTPLEAGQDATISGFSGSFAKGALRITIPGGALPAAAQVSATALTGQALSGPLPKGWSAVAALWLQLDGAALAAPATVGLALPAAAPESGLEWAHWDETARAWVGLAINVTKPQCAALSLPAAGGFALLVSDPVPTAPPAAELGKPLTGTELGPWRSGLAATGSVDPSVLPTVGAINGTRATAKLDLGFGGQDPVASGTGILVEIMETYTLLDQSLIEPQKRAQDAVAARFVLGVDPDGAPTLRSMVDGLSLELPVRMSRSFGATELVEGLIQVGFYHEDQVIAVGGELIGAAGGSTTRDGVTATFAAGAFASSTLVRVQADPAASWDGLWTELKDQGRVAASFNVDLAGPLAKGMLLSVAELGSVAPGFVPILVQRRSVADQRVVVAVGALELTSGGWTMSLPAESNPILEGGSFAVLVPAKPWAWVTGTASMPATLAQAIGEKLRNKPVINGDERRYSNKTVADITVNHRSSPVDSSLPPGDVAVKDALVSGNFLDAASGATGLFAMPAFAPSTGKLKLTGQRWDLGLTGSVEVDVPSTGNALRLSTVPFIIQAVLPPEGAVVEPATVFTVLTSAPMDPSALTAVRLWQGTTEAGVHRQLSLDGRTLMVTPDVALAQGASYTLVVEGLKSLAGETAPRIERKVNTVAPPPPPAEADFTRIALGYPDASFNVEMTLPAGAIPAGASILIEGLGMGYSYSGTMPNGELKLTIRAALG